MMKNKLKVYRAMHDLTQEQLADKVGVSRQTIISLQVMLLFLELKLTL